jgi:hypothetical protein
MTTTASVSIWDTMEHTPSLRQRAFLRYLTATLVDLAVLGLFAEYWEHVSVNSFTIMVLAAVLLPGGFNKFMRFFTAWLILFGSKFVILEALALAFGDRLHFGGPFHGIVALIVVVVAMLAVEAALVKFYRRLG